MSGQALRGDAWAARLSRLLDQAPGAVEQWIERRAHILKSDSHSRVGLLAVEGQLCYLKLYRYKSLLQRLGYRLGRGRAVSAFDAALSLRAAGVAAPEPLACLRVPGGVLLLTEGVADSADLKSLWLQGLDNDRLLQLLGSAAAVMARLHAAGYAHGDCKWSNFLCAGQEMLLIDLEAVRRIGRHSAAQWRDLARFTLNGEDMGLDQDHYDHFLAAYAEGVGRDVAELREGIRKPLLPLRRRHLERYGPRGHTLV